MARFPSVNNYLSHLQELLNTYTLYTGNNVFNVCTLDSTEISHLITNDRKYKDCVIVFCWRHVMLTIDKFTLRQHKSLPSAIVSAQGKNCKQYGANKLCRYAGLQLHEC